MSEGYVRVWTEAYGYMYEHRLVISKRLQRALSADDIVHHINGDKSDNRPENLQLMSRAEHMNEHREILVKARKAVPWRKTV